jgi:hypothetical protein
MSRFTLQVLVALLLAAWTAPSDAAIDDERPESRFKVGEDWLALPEVQ